MIKLQNISNDFGLRSKENDQILENNAKYGNESEFQDHKTMGSKSK